MARTYQQRQRAEAAAQTRRRILDAVYSALVESPTEEVNVSSIARRAGVVRSTVYTAFGDRSGLFDEFGSDLLHRAGFHELLAAADDPDPVSAVHDTIRITLSIYSQHHEALRSLFSQAKLDPDAFDGTVARLEAGRRQGMTAVAKRLQRDGALAATVSAGTATDVLCVLTSFDTFDMLSTGQSRSIRSIESTLLHIAQHSVLAVAQDGDLRSRP